MTDISYADKPKLKIRILISMMQREIRKVIVREYGKDVLKEKTVLDFIHDDLDNCTNPVIRRAWSKLKEASNHIEERHQSSVWYDIGAFGLWFIYKDTGYWNPAVWICNELINDNCFKEGIKNNTLQPGDWYVNRWTKTKDNTAELQKEGKLHKFTLSTDEKKFVPSEQRKIWKKLEDQAMKEYHIRK